LTELQVEVEENFGQWAICQRRLGQSRKSPPGA
jgi:hypothetical protein